MGWGLSESLRLAPVLASWDGKFLHSLPGDPFAERRLTLGLGLS